MYEPSKYSSFEERATSLSVAKALDVRLFGFSCATTIAVRKWLRTKSAPCPPPLAFFPPSRLVRRGRERRDRTSEILVALLRRTSKARPAVARSRSPLVSSFLSWDPTRNVRRPSCRVKTVRGNRAATADERAAAAGRRVSRRRRRRRCSAARAAPDSTTGRRGRSRRRARGPNR